MSIALNVFLFRPSATTKYARAFTAPRTTIRSLASIYTFLDKNDIDCFSSRPSSSVVLGCVRRLHSSSGEQQQHQQHYPQNKFSRLRSQLAATHRVTLGALPPSTSSTEEDLTPETSPTERTTVATFEEGTGGRIEVARTAVSVLAHNSRTWKRLAPIVELADVDTGAPQHDDDDDDDENDDRRTIADIGCDHGLLAIALAASGRYTGVIGVDVSSRALEDGALSFYRRMRHIIVGGGGTGKYDGYHGGTDRERERFLDSVLPVRFRVGDGLEPLCPGEADVVCIAGVGVHTMLSIIGRCSDSDHVYNIDRIGCNRLLLQPTNSRPRHLIKLYRELQEFGFKLADERIVYLSSRWYITSAFERSDDVDKETEELQFPGTILAARGDEELDRYVKHHSVWLENDLQQNANLDDDDVQWLKQIRSRQ